MVCDIKEVRKKLEKMNYGKSHAEARLACQNYFVILDRKNFESKFRNFHFTIPQKTVASSTLTLSRGNFTGNYSM